MKINMPVTDVEHALDEGTTIVSKTDLKGVITYVNVDFIRASGFTELELLGKSHNIVRHPDMPPAAFEDLWKTIKAGKPWTGLVKNRCKNGDFYWVRANVTPLWENDRVTGYLSVRSKPSRAEIEGAGELYRRMNAGEKIKPPLRERLNVLGKFSIRSLGISIGVLALAAVAVPICLLLAEIGAGLEFAAKERQGVEYISTLAKLLDDIPHHRGLATSYLEGDASAKTSLGALEAKMEEDLKLVDQADARLGASFSSTASWTAIREQWKSLKSSWNTLKSAESFEAHNALLNSVLSQITHVADASNLTLDPELATFYLMDAWVSKTPQSLQKIGIAHGLGTVAAVRKAIAEGDRERLGFMAESIRSTLEANQAGLGKVFAEVPALKTRLQSPLEAANNSQRAFVDMVENRVIKAGAIGLPSGELYAAGSEAIAATLKFHETLGAALDEALATRIASLSAKRLTALGVSLSLALLALLGLYYAMRRVLIPLRHAADGFMWIAQGDFTRRIEVRHADECGKVLNALRCVQTKLGFDMAELKRTASETLRIKAALDNASTNVMMADENFNIIYMNPAVVGMFKTAEADLRTMIPGFDADKLLGANIDVFHRNPEHQRRLLEKLTGTHKSEISIAGRHLVIIANPVLDGGGQRIGSVVEWADRTSEVLAEEQVNALLVAFRRGDMSHRVDIHDKTGFLRSLGEGLNLLAEDVDMTLKDFGQVIRSMSEGDLTRQTRYDGYEGVYGEFRDNLITTQNKLGEVFGQIRQASDFIYNSSQEIAAGNNNLSQRAEEQAASLEETASSMEELTGTVKQNAENASLANQVSVGARDLAEKGGEVVNRAVAAMSEINASSGKIANIISTIDEIAFQTNLLALNASVEAARAGEQGRGFAVVATEVRNLAQRSAKAAKESRELLQNSLEKVSAGSSLVTQSGGMLLDIVTSVKKTGDLVSEIAAASKEQAQGIQQVNMAVAQMDEITQQNAALAEQASAASMSMCEQAKNMVQLVGFFKTEGVGAAGGAPRGKDRPSAAIDFSAARDKHLAWKARVKDFLSGKATLTMAQAVSHRDCDLGKWLYSTGLKQYGHMREMRELESRHEKMHGLVRTIVDCKNRGDLRGAEADFHQLQALSDEIVSLLTAIEKRGSIVAEPKRPHAPPPKIAAAGGEDDWEEF